MVKYGVFGTEYYIKRVALHKILGLIKEQNKKLTHFTLHWCMHEQAEIHTSFFTEVQPKKITAKSEKCECYCSDQLQKRSACKSKPQY